MSHFPVYHRETAIALNQSYFKSIDIKKAGTQHRILGKLLASIPQDLSYFVVRRSFRREKFGYWQQHGHRGEPARYVNTRYYVVDHIDFIVASISWRTGAISEYAAFKTRGDADRALREYHTANRIEGS